MSEKTADRALVNLLGENKRLKKEITRLEKRNADLEEKFEEYRRARDEKEADDYYFNGSAPR